MGKGEKFGGTTIQRMGGIGREPPTGNGHLVPVKLEDMEGCSNSLAGVVAAESATLA